MLQSIAAELNRALRLSPAGDPGDGAEGCTESLQQRGAASRPLRRRQLH